MTAPPTTAMFVPLPDGQKSTSDAGPALTLRDVYEAHWEFVWRALRACGVREADREDQTHEVFLVVQRKLPEFEGRARITTWLFAIAQRVASDWRRKAHVRRERLAGDAQEDLPAPPSPSAEDAVARRQAREALEWMLDAMPPEQRVVFAFFELDGLSAEEVAALVDAPLNTVYSRLRLARRHFERSLARLRARGGW